MRGFKVNLRQVEMTDGHSSFMIVLTEKRNSRKREIRSCGSSSLYTDFTKPVQFDFPPPVNLRQRGRFNL